MPIEKDPTITDIDVDRLAVLLPAMGISDIALVIRDVWTKPYFGAEPYIQAMRHLSGVDSMYGADSGREIVMYFLANASRWHGAVAKLVKRELNRRLKAK
jgi:hypothetical protein